MTLLIQASAVAFAHGGNDVFTDLTFEIREGDRIAVVGENGSGKSTLFRLLARPLNEHQALSVLAEFLFDRDDALRPVAALSGGQRSRLQVALLMLGEANFLLLDEPTNNLDIGSRETLEDALLGFGGSLIAISHDRYFVDRLCTRIVEVDAGIVRDFAGPFRYYRAHPDKGTMLTRALRDVPATGELTRTGSGRRRAADPSRRRAAKG